MRSVTVIDLITLLKDCGKDFVMQVSPVNNQTHDDLNSVSSNGLSETDIREKCLFYFGKMLCAFTVLLGSNDIKAPVKAVSLYRNGRIVALRRSEMKYY